MENLKALGELIGGSPLILFYNSNAYCFNGKKYDVTKYWQSIKRYSAIIQTNGVVTEVPEEDLFFVMLKISNSVHLVLSCFSIEEMTKDGHYISYKLSKTAIEILNKVNISTEITKKTPKDVWEYLKIFLIIRLAKNGAVNLLTNDIDNWDGQDQFVQKNILEKSMVQALSIIIRFDLDELLMHVDSLLDGKIELLVGIVRTLSTKCPDNPMCPYFNKFIESYDSFMRNLNETPASHPQKRKLEAILESCQKRYALILGMIVKQEAVLGIKMSDMPTLVGTQTHQLPESRTQMEKQVVCVPEHIITLTEQYELTSVKSSYKARKSNLDTKAWGEDRIRDLIHDYRIENTSVSDIQELLTQDKEFLRFVKQAIPFIRKEYIQTCAEAAETPALAEYIYVDIHVLIARRRTELWAAKRALKKAKNLQKQFHACLDAHATYAATCSSLQDWTDYLEDIGKSARDIARLEKHYKVNGAYLRKWIKQLADMEKILENEEPFLYEEGASCRIENAAILNLSNKELSSCRKKIQDKAKWRFHMLPQAFVTWLCELNYLEQKGESNRNKTK